MYKLLTFKDLGDERGKLVVIEGSQDIPFDIARAFYIYGSDATVVRGQHANRNSEFVLVNVAGKSKVMITDGTRNDFSPDSVLLVLANTHYDGSEYIRDFDAYIDEMKTYKE